MAGERGRESFHSVIESPRLFVPKISSLSEPRPPIFTLGHLCFTLESVKFLPPRLFTSFRHDNDADNSETQSVANLVLGWVLHMTSRDPKMHPI